MSEEDKRWDTAARLFKIMGMVIAVLCLMVALDYVADNRDIHEIRDLQRRVAELEQKQ